MFILWILLPQFSQCPTGSLHCCHLIFSLAEGFTASHSLWSVPSIRGDGESPWFKTGLALSSSLMQLGATVFPYYLFSYFMCSNGIFRTLVFYTIGIFRHTKICLYLSTCCSSDFPNFFFIDKVCIFLNKKLILPVLLCYGTSSWRLLRKYVCQCLLGRKTSASFLISREPSGIKFQCAE